MRRERRDAVSSEIETSRLFRVNNPFEVKRNLVNASVIDQIKRRRLERIIGGAKIRQRRQTDEGERESLKLVFAAVEKIEGRLRRRAKGW